MNARVYKVMSPNSEAGLGSL